MTDFIRFSWGSDNALPKLPFSRAQHKSGEMAFLAPRSILAYKPMGLPWDWRASIFTKAIGLQPL